MDLLPQNKETPDLSLSVVEEPAIKMWLWQISC